MQFVYVKVPLGKETETAMTQVHEAVDRALSAPAVGTLLSWGTSVPDPAQAARGVPVYHRLDIEAHDQHGTLRALRAALALLSSPSGTELHYTVSGNDLQEVYSGTAWGPPVPSTASRRPRAS